MLELDVALGGRAQNLDGLYRARRAVPERSSAVDAWRRVQRPYQPCATRLGAPGELLLIQKGVRGGIGDIDEEVVREACEGIVSVVSGRDKRLDGAAFETEVADFPLQEKGVLDTFREIAHARLKKVHIRCRRDARMSD